MSKTLEKLILFILDFLGIQIAFHLWCKLRLIFGFYTEVSLLRASFLSVIIFLFWFFLLLFFGHYKTWFTPSRTDEFISISKTITIGVVIIFLLTFDLGEDFSNFVSLSRLVIVLYWVLMVICVGVPRLLLRTVHRKLLEAGIGRKPALIVGWGKKAKELSNQILEAPALGYDVIGFVTPGQERTQGSYKKIPIKGPVSELHRIIRKEAVHDVLIALPRRSERLLEEVIIQCDGTAAGMKIVPDLYDVIIGQVRTNQIYGFPLIEILPQTMPAWEQAAKRGVDIFTSFLVLVGFLPLWLLLVILIRTDSEGPIFYHQKRVGKDGKVFTMIKFRSMVHGAEKMTGPVWASWNDPRVTRFGRFMRRLRLDEIPQAINVIKGDMSLVGPRPERPYFVEKLRKALPLYGRRLRVRPGITGWAQVKGEYDQSIEHVKQKLAYDLYYLENMSMRMDLKIILNTLYVMLMGRGQ